MNLTKLSPVTSGGSKEVPPYRPNDSFQYDSVLAWPPRIRSLFQKKIMDPSLETTFNMRHEDVNGNRWRFLQVLNEENEEGECDQNEVYR